MTDKTVYKIGEMIIDNKQIFWKMKYCYALIPIVQLLDGRTIFPIQIYCLSQKDKLLSFHSLSLSKYSI